MNRKFSWSMAATLGVFSPAVWALGLGGASVDSFLGQSLDVRVEVISDSSEELQSITAGLASAEDFELLGLSRSAITVPLEFELVTSDVRPYIHITSDLKVSEPVVQVLVEVVWANGRMLREYTLFLDPPTFDSTAPPVTIKPASQPVIDTTPPAATDPAPVEIDRSTPEPVVQEPVPEAQVSAQSPVEQSTPEEADTDVSVEEDPVAADSEARMDEQVPETEPVSGDEQASADNAVAEDEVTAEQGSVEEAGESATSDQVYGPVANGETLWGIARDFSQGSGYSVNQAMLALQRKNPDAFMHGNINALKRGAILRLPEMHELGELSTREALMEAMRQGEEMLVASRPPATDFSTPTVADSGDYQETFSEPEPEVVPEEDEGHLELVPPGDETTDELSAEQNPEQTVSTDAIKEELSRTEEELVNAQQENAYLSQRIQELEAEAQAKAESAISVEDSDLASIESNLAEERAADKPEPPVAVTPGGEAQAWYAGKTGLIIGIAVVLIGLVAWALRRRSVGLVDAEQGESVQAIADEAEEILRALDSDEVESDTVVELRPEDEAPSEPESEPKPEPESEPEPDFEPEPEFEHEPEPVHEPADESEDELDDLVIDDPETKLDLARAYLSLGDKEASRSMLEEVLNSGSEEQKAEARQMMDEI